MSTMGNKPKPTIHATKDELTAAAPDLDDETTEALGEILGLSHGQRATLAAVLEASEPVSARRLAGMTGYSDVSVRSSLERLERLGLVETDKESHPHVSTETPLAERAERALREAGGFDLSVYLDLGDDSSADSSEPEPETTSEPDSQSGNGDDSNGSGNPSLDAIAAAISDGGTFSPLNPGGKSRQNTTPRGSNSSQSGNGVQTWDERPAANWEPVDVEPSDESLEDTAVALAAEMAGKALQERQSNLELERVRAAQVSAFADMLSALTTIRREHAGDGEQRAPEAGSEPER